MPYSPSLANESNEDRCDKLTDKTQVYLPSILYNIPFEDFKGFITCDELQQDFCFNIKSHGDLILNLDKL